MQWLYAPQFFLIVLLVVVFLIVVLFILFRKLSAQYRQLDMHGKTNELALEDLQSAQQVLEEKINNITCSYELKEQEDIQVSKQFEHRIKTIKQEINQINTVLEQLKSHQPQDKLYTRAYKLAALGADIEEIMAECELPKAEVEMLLSVYKPK